MNRDRDRDRDRQRQTERQRQRETESITSKKENAFCHLIEQVLYTRNLHLITPFAFKRNLITYSITNSKTAMQLQEAWKSSGSYAKLHDTVTAKTNPVECPLGDLHNTVDNNQIMKNLRRINSSIKHLYYTRTFFTATPNLLPE